MSVSFQERFWAKVRKTPTCWEWTAGCFPTGYGAIWQGVEMGYAHRVSYELHGGVIPPGKLVCHSCDNKKCVNPAHLWLGSDADNAADKVRKGRHPIGEQHRLAILTESDVLLIRRSADSLRVLAKRYGVCFQTVRAARIGRSWRHVGTDK